MASEPIDSLARCLRAELEILRLHEKIDNAVIDRLDAAAERETRLIALLELTEGRTTRP